MNESTIYLFLLLVLLVVSAYLVGAGTDTNSLVNGIIRVTAYNPITNLFGGYPGGVALGGGTQR